MSVTGRHARTRFLPIEPTLSTGMLLPGRHRPAPVFPFTGSRHRWYYFGRGAVWHGIKLLGLAEGDEVLMPAYNQGVELAAVLDAGPSVQFFGISRELEIDFDDLRARVSPKTKAILVIHYVGFPQPLAEITSVCREHGLWLIEDCAQALFSSADGQPLGTSGAFSIFCAYKTISLPHGGILAVNDPSLGLPPEARPPRFLSSVRGLPQRWLDHWEMRHRTIGRLVRLGVRRPARMLLRRTSPQSMHVGVEEYSREQVDLGVSNLTKSLVHRADAEAIVHARRRNFEALMALVPRDRQLIPMLPEGVCPLFFPVLVEDKAVAIRTLAQEGIEAIPFWSTAHPAIPVGAFPVADYLRAHVLEVPVHQALDPADMTYLAEALESIPRPAPMP